MKIIDLLNKIAKGEEVPKKIKYNGVIYIKDNDGDIDYYFGEDFNSTLLLEKLTDTNELKDIVEIIEEEKEIRKITKEEFERLDKRTLLELIVKNQNELIDVINDMRDKE